MKAILFVDDHEVLARLSCEILEMQGYRAVCAASGAEALEKFAQEEFDLLVTDFRMEGMNGMELARKVHERTPDVPVIIVTGYGPVVGEAIAAPPDVDMVSFTGSTRAGTEVARLAAPTVKRVHQELGGKSPNIILDNADFEKAIPMAVAGCYLNNGQACIAASRLIVPEGRLEEVKKLAKAAAEKMNVGDPKDKKVNIGPLASVKQYNRVQEYIQAGIDEGAELVTGGLGHPAGLEKGNFVKPTVFANVTNSMRIAREEIFGPVLSIITYKTEAEAIAIANDSDFGLIAYVSSSDKEMAERVASELKAGRVLINTLKHDPLAPFGGYKQSGFGREGGILGLEEYLEPKAYITE